jgi:NADPH2:quinone reductase
MKSSIRPAARSADLQSTPMPKVVIWEIRVHALNPMANCKGAFEMKAIRVREFGEPEVMKIEEIEDPTPGAGEVVVNIKAVGVNPVETYIRKGIYGDIPLPYTPGTDAAGVVESVGENVTEFKPGDRVYTSGSLTGTYAQKCLCSQSQVHPLPETISFEQGAALYIPFGTAWQALFARAKGMAGESLLVHGASGGVGLAAIQFGRAAGMRVIGTAGTEDGLRLVRENGAHIAINHTSPDQYMQILKATEHKGVDVILEMLANVNLADDLEIIAPHGRVVVIGNRGKVEIDPRLMMRKDSCVMGMMLVNATEKEFRGIFAGIAAGLENGYLNPIIGKRFPLSEAPAAHHAIMETRATGKIVLVNE